MSLVRYFLWRDTFSLYTTGRKHNAEMVPGTIEPSRGALWSQPSVQNICAPDPNHIRLAVREKVSPNKGGRPSKKNEVHCEHELDSVGTGVPATVVAPCRSPRQRFLRTFHMLVLIYMLHCSNSTGMAADCLAPPPSVLLDVTICQYFCTDSYVYLLIDLQVSSQKIPTHSEHLPY
jgi:hypothetical protein